VGATKSNFLYRNGVLAALSETLVVIQAHRKSGSRNACAWARDLGRPVWAMTSAPWMTSFGGTADEIELRGARPLCSATQLLLALGLEQRRPPRRPRPAAEARQLPLEPRKPGRARPSSRIPETPPEPPSAEPWTADESLVFSKVSKRAQHVDQIVDATGLQVPSVATALLTLSLKDVVVEGPDGFFRRT
jgi:DNA processing protein